MPICEHCKVADPAVILRQSDENLCDGCDRRRIAGLERERLQREQRVKLRSSSTGRADGLTPPLGNPPVPEMSAQPTTIHEEDDDGSTHLQSREDTDAVDAMDTTVTGTSQEPVAGDPGDPTMRDTTTQEAARSRSEPDSATHCHAQCKHGNVITGDMIRCCMCFRSHHEKCITDGSIDKSASWWLCSPCRSLPGHVSVLSDMVMQLQDTLSKVLETNNKLVSSVNDITTHNKKLESSIINLCQQNDTLMAQVTSLSTEVIGSQKRSPVNPSPPKRPTLLIGGSSIRDIACTDTSGLYVVSRGGAKTRDVLNMMKGMDTDSYGDVIVHVGQNDSSTKFPLENINKNIEEIAVHAIRISNTGVAKFSSITPCTDKPEACAKGAEINESMKAIAIENGCEFVCNQDNFECKNGDINTELLSLDGLHLSQCGTNRLISNLKLSTVASCRFGRSQRPGGEIATPSGQDRARRQASAGQPRRPQHERARPQHERATNGTQPRWLTDRTPVSERRDYSSGHAKTYDYRQPARGHSTPGDNSMYSPMNCCDFCGESNHRRHKCRFGMPVRCHHCHEVGHKEKFCGHYSR